MGTRWPSPEQIEQQAIRLYEADSMMLALYPTGEQSWPHDRESVRQRYRDQAKQQLGLTSLHYLSN